MAINNSYAQSDVSVIESASVTSDTVTNQTITNIKIDFSDVVRSSFEVFKMAYDLGRNSFSGVQESINLIPMPDSISKLYVGVYDQTSYGVYDDPNKLQKSKGYWNASSLVNREFELYDDALKFARNGVAQLKGVSANSIPEMQCRVNWRQKV